MTPFHWWTQNNLQEKIEIKSNAKFLRRLRIDNNSLSVTPLEKALGINLYLHQAGVRHSLLVLEHFNIK